MARLSFLGSCKEVGRSCFFIEEKDESVLVDYGVKFSEPPKFPDMIPTEGLQGVALTHAHLDHSGGIPLILKETEASLFCTPATRDLSILLLRDMYKISRGRLPFTLKDIANVRKQCQSTSYEETMPLGNYFEMTLFNAGHIPGSAMVSIRVDDKRILFTGDFNATETHLNPGARKNLPKHDIVVTESTYARRINPPRETTEEALIQTVIETLEHGGTVLIPAFGVGRSQEIMCILERANLPKKYPIYIDGMARDVNEILIRHPQYLQSPQALQRAAARALVINDDRDRKNAVKKGGVIISPAGMLKGGASHLYFKMLHDDPKNAIVFVSFQIPGTPGEELLRTGRVIVGNREFKVTADIRQHHLSSHSDSRGLIDMLTKIPGEPEFYLVHGEPESCDALAEKLEKRGKKAHVAELNEKIRV